MKKIFMIFILFFFALSLFKSDLFSFRFQLKNGVLIDLPTTVKWGGAWRVEDQDDKILKNINADDGDRNFDKGDMINNRFSIIIDGELKYKNFGIFVRPRAYYDFAYKGKNANDSYFTNNNVAIYGGPLSKKDEFMDEVEHLYKRKAEILDAYAYGEFNLSGHRLNLRIGKQVVSWGESIFLLNSISSAQSPIDGTAANAPGTELRDIFLPVAQVYAQFDLTSKLTLQTYYQFQYEQNRLDEAGAYFSSTDYLYRAGRRFLIPILPQKGLAVSIDRSGIDYAKDSGQWGIALRYFAENLNATDFGLYYINYHSKMPQIVGSFSGGHRSIDWTKLIPGKKGFILNLLDQSSYEIKYYENIELVGFSFGTTLGDINVSGEVSYRWHYPVMVTNPKSNLKFIYKDACALQAQVSFMSIISQSLALLWDQATITGEIGYNQVNGVKASKLKNDKSAWGGVVKFEMKYFNVLFPELTLAIPIKYKFNPSGVSSVLGTFTKHSDSVSTGLNFNLHEVYSFGINYTAYIGGAKHNSLNDRDYISVDFKYTF